MSSRLAQISDAILGLSCNVSSQRVKLLASESQSYYSRLHIYGGENEKLLLLPRTQREMTFFFATFMVVLIPINGTVAAFPSNMQRWSHYQATRTIIYFVNLPFFHSWILVWLSGSSFYLIWDCSSQYTDWKQIIWPALNYSCHYAHCICFPG